MVRRLALLMMLTVGGGLVGPTLAEASLRGYVQRADATYRYEVVSQGEVAGVQRYVVRMQSQTWRGRAWRHWLTVAVPNEVEHAERAVLMVGGGSMQSEMPIEPGKPGVAAAAARAIGAPVAMLHQVPNQPLFDGMYEDAAIAHTFEQYLRAANGDGEAGGAADGAGGDWPLLLPMVKSVVRAMDTVEQVLADEHGLAVDGYMVTGSSKRGWTAWLTAAVDRRVRAIAPMVIDVLNFAPQMRQQQATYGQASPMIRDYTQRGLLAALSTEAGRSLMALVDPFAYRDRLTLPKLIVLGTNDPYWTVDAANLYVDELDGPTHLAYVPNAGHQVSGRAADTLLAFAERTFAGRAMPTVALTREAVAEGDAADADDEAVRLRVTWDEPAARVTLWQADAAGRDFREATWRPRVLEADETDAAGVGGGAVSVTLREPAEGWRAAFVEVTFTDERPFALTTPMTVVPTHFPARPRGERHRGTKPPSHQG